MSEQSTASSSIQLHVRDGMSQTRRHLAALEEGYFNVDEMRFEQLLTQTQDYARLMKFHSPDQRTTKNDIPLFAQDELVVMAQILSVDLQDLEARFTQRLNRELGNYQWVIEETRNPASPIGLVRLLDTWLNLLKHPQSSAGEHLYSLIESIILGLARELENLWLTFSEHLNSRQWVSPYFIQLIRSEIPALSHQSETQNAIDDESVDLRSPYASLLKAIDMIQVSARQLLPESLNSQLHDPALGLRVVFIQLYQKLQHKLNRFTINYMDFYVEQVLQAKPRPQQPDRVYLIIQPGAAEREILLPRHTDFHAGVDKNSQEIIYASDHEVLINDAQVTRMHSLFFPRTTATDKPALADGCWLNTFTVNPNPGKKERDKLNGAPFFGASREQKSASELTSARLGFAFANKVLLLREGKRKITLTLLYEKIRKMPWSSLERLLDDLPALKDTDTSNKAKFFAYFGNIFQFSLTTAEGWLDITEYKPAYQGTDADIKDNALQFTFYLRESSPTITAYDPLVHSDNYPTVLPLLRATLKDNYQQYPYDMLKHLVLKEVRIQVDVEGCHDVMLHNNIGQLSPLAPFTPFGPIPEVGSYFIVGHEETRNKQLTHFEVDIEWKGLPMDVGGFAHWYRGYNPIKQNHQFQASVSVLADGRWQPGTADTSLYQPLFNTRHRNGQELLLSHKKLSAKNAIAYFKPQDHQQAKRPFHYSPQTRAGLFKFTLQEPLGGFGHREYTTLLAETLTHNARVKELHQTKALPNAPYTPEISSISINYSAVSIVRLSETDKLTPQEYRDQFFHLYPAGWEAISPLRHPRIHLVPQYDADGSLFIGISGSKFENLSLFFHLQNNSLPLPILKSDEDGEELPPAALLQWSYLGNNKWHTLGSQHILSDSTQGFMQTGIVTLSIPENMTNDNTLMPSGLYWLKISANQSLKYFSYLYAVYAQAVQASWRSGAHPESTQPMQLPANTIKRTRSAIPGIGGIIQLSPSFGGITAESKSHLRTRISERLRHKNRALTPLDYEMLILEHFPAVHKVKCFANLSTQPPHIKPGHILIVPVPAADGENFKPHFDGHIIQEIRDYITPLAPERVRISVENPLYEEIQVRCSVRLRKGYHAGKHHNLLNQALSDYLSPWSVELGNHVHFGWNISEQEIKSFIHNLEYIEHVTDFSLLRIAPREEGYFILDDSAVPGSPAALSHKIVPTYVWSTAVPLANHYIQTLDSNLQIVAEMTGYDELEIGSTFIISE